jgi:hypothetical protein
MLGGSKMIRYMIIVLMVLFPVMAFASPYLVSNAQEGVAYYQVVEGAVTSEVPAQENGSLRMEMAGTSVGLHNITVQACTMWECSETVPFVYTRPASVAKPAGITLVK